MSLARLPPLERAQAERALAWACGGNLHGFPPAREVCGWLAEEVIRQGEPGGNVERGWQACCHLLLIAGGVISRPPRTGLQAHPLVALAIETLGLEQV